MPVRSSPISRRILASVIVLVAGGTRAIAGDQYWMFQGDPSFEPVFNGAFAGPAYWNGLAVPGLGDVVHLGAPPWFAPPPPPVNPLGLSPHTIYFGNFNHRSFQTGITTAYGPLDASVHELVVWADTWTLDFGSGIGGWGPAMPAPATGSLTTTASLRVGLNPNASAALNIRNGTLTSQGVSHLGWEVGSAVRLNVSGPAARWVNGAWLDLGWEGQGTLEVMQGGQVEIGGGIAAGIRDLAVGNIVIRTGGRLMTPQAVVVGSGHESSGTARGTLVMSDAGSLLSAGVVFVGASGGADADLSAGAHLEAAGELRVGSGGLIPADLRLSGGASVHARTVSIGTVGNRADNTCSVSGDGTRMSVDESLSLGSHTASGTLTVSAGGEVVQAGSGVFVHNSLIRVQDAGSSLVAPFMWLGNGGSAGSLEVLGGATVRCSVGLGPYDVNLNAMSVRVAGPGSRLTGLYETNQGSTLVEQGGAVSSLHPVNATPEDVYVGQSISGSGLITVRDAGSVFDGIATLTLGGVYHSDTDGRGELRVLGGASVQAGRVQIAQRTPPGMPASVLLATGAGSSVVVANDLVVGLDGRGLVRIESGANVSSLRGQVGYNPASHGSAVVTGGASWSVGEWIGVGEFSRGDLAVDGGTVSAANLVAVGGGAGGLGSATVSNGGTLSAGNTIAVGSGAGSSGTVEVIGAGSVATAGAVISIGEDGATGSVTVDQGGLLRATTNALNVGLSSDGDMTVSDGGIVECVFARVGRLAGSTGSVLVTGANSRWTASSTLFLGGHTATGPGGDAALTVSSGAFVNAGASIGMWRDATLDVTGGGRVLAGAATPAGVPAGSIAVGGGGLLFGGGFILGNVHMLGGTLAPAFAEGSITLRGGLTVGSDASVVATISGSGHFDTVTATGPIQLAGSLRVATLGGYLPGYGDGFDVLVGSTIIGAFDTTETPGYSVSYLPDRVRLTPICDPDYNQDGALNQDDVDAIINDIASGTPSFPPNSPDLNRDGNVDQDDVAWLVNVIAGGNCS